MTAAPSVSAPCPAGLEDRRARLQRCGGARAADANAGGGRVEQAQRGGEAPQAIESVE